MSFKKIISVLRSRIEVIFLSCFSQLVDTFRELQLMEAIEIFRGKNPLTCSGDLNCHVHGILGQT
jgi:hypothetical protein